MEKNAINWFEIPVSDLDRAKGFYETVFQIAMQSIKIGDTHQFAPFPGGQEDGSVSGALMCGEGYVPSSEGALVYLNANPDLQQYLDRVVEAGGSIVMPKRQISEEVGFMAVITDTEGNRLALHSVG